MAYTTGTSADAVAFYAALINYLKTDATLVSLGENWTEVWSGSGAYANDKVLRGPGLSAADQIYIGFRLEETAPGDSYRIDMVGMTGIILTALQYDQHINVSAAVGVMVDVNPMDYWIVASGRRFVFVTKMSTVYQMGYGGFFLPYGDPIAYPYPLFVGGTTRLANAGSMAVNTWRSTADSHRNFSRGLRSGDSYPPALMLDPIGQWKQVGGNPNVAVDTVLAPVSFGDSGNSWNIQSYLSSIGEYIGYYNVASNMAPCFDGSYALTPFTILQVTPEQTYGVLDGVFFCPGQGNSSENLITIGGVDHLVVQNIFRTATGEFLALKLE